MSASPSLRPLAEGNRLQRAYARWATPRYAKLPAEAREAAELLDRFLYSRRGLGVWLGLGGALAGTALGLRASGMHGGIALLLAVLLWVVLPASLLAAWLAPSRFSSALLWRKLPLSGLLALAGAACGFALAHWGRHGSLDLPALLQALQQHALTLVPAALLGSVAVAFVTWAVAGVRRQVLERQLAQAELQRQRDQAAHAATQTQLRLLQAQIQPHFIFNTLAAVQHWVDTGDPRAGPLLRALTQFLRGSTELLAHERVALADEAALVQHYLEIMQARLGGRLQFSVDVQAAPAAAVLPPGLLLTLVENAVEHGIAPRLAGGRVDVRAGLRTGGWQLSVQDDGAGLAPGWQAGTGLANCRQRLAHVYGARARLLLAPATAAAAPTAKAPETAATPARGTCARIEIDTELAV
jgi:hypothetical protein